MAEGPGALVGHPATGGVALLLQEAWRERPCMAGDVSAPETLPVSPGDPLLLSEKDGPQIGLGPRIFHQQKHSRAFYLAPYFTYRETMVQRGRGSQTDVSACSFSIPCAPPGHVLGSQVSHLPSAHGLRHLWTSGWL